MTDKDTILNNWDLSTVPSPCYVLHETLLAMNLEVIDKVRKATGAEIIVALKANAMWSIFPELRKHADGATASSLAEAVSFLKNMVNGLTLMHLYMLGKRLMKY